jgi:hypothetical protein
MNRWASFGLASGKDFMSLKIKESCLKYLRPTPGLHEHKWLWASLAILVLAAGFGTPSKGKDKKYQRSVPLVASPMLVRVDKQCATFAGELSAGDFFKGLRQVDTAKGEEFQRKGKAVSSFPDEVLAVLRVMINGDCSDKKYASFPTLSLDVLRASKFRVSWEGAVETRTVQNFSVTERRIPLSMVDFWEYRIEIPATNVPLNYRLSIVLLSTEQEPAIRFVGEL